MDLFPIFHEFHLSNHSPEVLLEPYDPVGGQSDRDQPEHCAEKPETVDIFKEGVPAKEVYGLDEEVEAAAGGVLGGGFVELILIGFEVQGVGEF